MPVEGEPCVGDDEGVNRDGTWVSVTELDSTGTLSVGYGGSSVPLG
ncbi:hypothetical protein AB0N31_05660 [Streptomyces sp. NPDC051051]